MAVKRMIATNIWQDEFIGTLPLFDRLVWLALITYVDDQGRMMNNPILLLAHGFPYDRELSYGDIERSLNKFAEAGKIIFYKAGNKSIIQVVRWWDYQNPSWPQASKLPAPENWTDRIKMHVVGNNVISKNMDKKGGFTTHSDLLAYTDNLIDITLSDRLDESRVEEINYAPDFEETEQKSGSGGIFDLYQQTFGLFPQGILIDELVEYEKKLPMEQLRRAFEITAEQNKRSWAYTKRIIDRWRVEGYDGGSWDKPAPKRKPTLAEEGYTDMTAARLQRESESSTP